jgi:hypothetical protein
MSNFFEYVGLLLSVAQVVQGFMPALNDHRESSQQETERVNLVACLIEHAKGLSPTKRQELLDHVLQSKDLRSILSGAAPKSEFEEALSFIRKLFTTSNDQEQISAWANTLEGKAMAQSGSPGERIIYEHTLAQNQILQNQSEQLEIMKQAVAQIAQGTLNLPSSRKPSLRDVAAQARSIHPDVQHVAFDSLGGLSIKFKPNTRVGYLRLTQAGKDRLDAFIAGRGNLKFDDSDSEIQFEIMHSLLRELGCVDI